MAGDGESSAAPGAPEDSRVYRNPALTVDMVVLARSPSTASCQVLLIRRGREPFAGYHALPGGFVDYGENPDHAVSRELEEETGLSGLHCRQFRVYGDPARDPRGHTVSIVYVALAPDGPLPVRAGDDAAEAAWFPVDELPPLAFDHDRIVSEVLAAAPWRNPETRGDAS